MSAERDFQAIDAVLDLLLQIRVGKDFPSAKGLMFSISQETAFASVPTAKFNIATYVAHASFWQDIWLAKLKGSPGPSLVLDWQEPQAGSWQQVRDRFLSGLEEAIVIASSRPFVHAMSDERSAINTLFQIGLHDSYHMGQIVLLKRMVKGGRA